MTEHQDTHPDQCPATSPAPGPVRAVRDASRQPREHRERDAAGQPTNVATLLGELRRTDPDLFEPATGGTGDDGTGSGRDRTTSPNDVLRRQLRGYDAKT